MAWKWKLHIISIHAPTRGATISFAVGSTLSIFQSTLLQEERPHEKSLNELMQISIHAPTRGATDELDISSMGEFISIHAPTRGATVELVVANLIYMKFQSTLLQEERRARNRI